MDDREESPLKIYRDDSLKMTYLKLRVRVERLFFRSLLKITNASLSLAGKRLFHAQWSDHLEINNIKVIDTEKNEDITGFTVWFVGPSKPGVEFTGFVARIWPITGLRNGFMANSKGEPMITRFYGRFKWERKA
jgi:hypothetical protein